MGTVKTLPALSDRPRLFSTKHKSSQTTGKYKKQELYCNVMLLAFLTNNYHKPVKLFID